jgi:hypothetical protein
MPAANHPPRASCFIQTALIRLYGSRCALATYLLQRDRPTHPSGCAHPAPVGHTAARGATLPSCVGFIDRVYLVWRGRPKRARCLSASFGPGDHAVNKLFSAMLAIGPNRWHIDQSKRGHEMNSPLLVPEAMSFKRASTVATSTKLSIFIVLARLVSEHYSPAARLAFARRAACVKR